MLIVPLLLLLLVPGGPQARRYPGVTSSRGSSVNTDAIASFTGTFKSADKKFIVVGVEDGESIKAYVTGKTKFVRDGKAVKASAFEEGELVLLDCERDLRMNMVAVKLELAPKKAPAKEAQP